MFKDLIGFTIVVIMLVIFAYYGQKVTNEQAGKEINQYIYYPGR